jgi:hypothetical protein
MTDAVKVPSENLFIPNQKKMIFPRHYKGLRDDKERRLHP